MGTRITSDFQRLLGLALYVAAAVRAVERHRDESTVNTLVEAVAPEGLAIEAGAEEDEVELDPAAIHRPDL